MRKAVSVGMLEVVEELSFVAIILSGCLRALHKLSFNIVPGLVHNLSKFFPGPLMLLFPLAAGFRLHFSPGLISKILPACQRIAQANSRPEVDIASFPANNPAVPPRCGGGRGG